MKRYPGLKFWSKLLLSLGLLIFIFRSIDLDTFWQTLQSAYIPLIILQISLFFPVQMISTYRWYYILRQLGQPMPYWSAMRYTMLGQVATLFLPSRVSGDIVRTIAAFTATNSKTILILSAIIDKLSLLAAISVCAFIGVIWSDLLSKKPIASLVVFILMTAVLLALLLFAHYRNPTVICWFAYLQKRLPNVIRRRLPDINMNTHLPYMSLRSIWIVFTLACTFQIIGTFANIILASALGLNIAPIDWLAIIAIVIVDKIFLQESHWFTETYFLKKCSHRAQWKTVKKNEIKNIRTGQALISTKVVAIAVFKL